MKAYENHWLNKDIAWEAEMSEPEETIEVMPVWYKLKWEKIELLDTDVDERSECWLVEMEDSGKTYQGTATYVHDELKIIEDVELKTE